MHDEHYDDEPPEDWEPDPHWLDDIYAEVKRQIESRESLRGDESASELAAELAASDSGLLVASENAILAAAENGLTLSGEPLDGLRDRAGLRDLAETRAALRQVLAEARAAFGQDVAAPVRRDHPAVCGHVSRRRAVRPRARGRRTVRRRTATRAGPGDDGDSGEGEPRRVPLPAWLLARIGPPPGDRRLAAFLALPETLQAAFWLHVQDVASEAWEDA